MQDITKGTQAKIHLNVYTDNILVQADSLPTVSIYDADNSTVALVGYSNNVVDEEPTGVYSYLLTPNLTNIERMLKVVWHYYINGQRFDQEALYRISTVYASISDIQDFLNFGASPANLNYQSPEKIASAEKIARSIIEGYTGQKFSTYYGSQEVYGKGSDACQLVEKMLSIDKVWENDVLMIDNTAVPPYNTFGFPLEISPTGRAIRIVNAGWDVRYDNNVDPAVLYYGRFRDNARYKFQGKVGYTYVPEDIKLAAILLVNDILANDFNWRNKYLKKVDLSEISFEMAGGAFNGTGNVTVDNILDQYRNVNIVII
jgi:hypothetical protein